MNRHALFIMLMACCLAGTAAHAQPSPLTVQQIMQDPDTWVGAWPSAPFWSEDGETLYFRWNPMGRFPSDSLFKVARTGGEPMQAPPAERRNLGPTFDGWHHGEHVYDASFTRKVYERDGDLFLYNRATRERLRRKPAQQKT